MRLQHEAKGTGEACKVPVLAPRLSQCADGGGVVGVDEKVGARGAARADSVQADDAGNELQLVDVQVG